jgi:TonB-dependent receptor
VIFDHKFDELLGVKDLEVKLSYAYSENSQDEPDTRFSDTLIEGNQPDTFDSTDFGQPVRYERLLDQEDNIFKVDFELPLAVKQLEETKLRFGFSNEDTTRIVSQREFLRAQFDDSSFDDFGTSNPDTVIDLGIPGVPPIVIPGEPHFSYIPGVTVIDTGVAEGSREIQSLYLQSVISPVEKFEFTLGARLEDTFIEAVSLEPGKLTRFVFEPVVESRPIDEKKVLPAFTAAYDLTDKLKLRLGVSETVAKPSFRELNPNPTFNPITGDAEIGNPGVVFQNAGSTDTVLPDEFSGLELVDVTNFDVRAEWFYTDEDFISLSFFNKQVDGPIERISVLTGGGASFTFFNNDNVADLFGAELEARMCLSHLSDSLNNFYVGGNYTYIDAAVERSSLETSILSDNASNERALYNQPEDILNAFVGYRNEPLGLDVTLSANQVGRQLYGVIPAADIFTDPYLTINLVINWEITENISIRLSGKNLLDPLKERSFDTFGEINDNDGVGGPGGVAGPETDFSIRDSYRSGRTYSISASFDL